MTYYFIHNKFANTLSYQITSTSFFILSYAAAVFLHKLSSSKKDDGDEVYILININIKWHQKRWAHIKVNPKWLIHRFLGKILLLVH